MKVLMFGWEYPPHVFGGLATANYGISEGLKAQGSACLSYRRYERRAYRLARCGL